MSFRKATAAVVLLLLGAGTALAASPNIVIGQFRTRGPSGGNDEYVVLFNRSTNAVDVSGWKLRGSNSSGSAIGDRAVLPAGTVIQGGGHYLLANVASSGYSGTKTPDLTYTTGIANDGGLAITLPDNTVMDSAGMSATCPFKEGTQLAQMSVNQDQMYERKDGGTNGNCVDSDNNSGDFTLVTPGVPLNSGDPTYVCSVSLPPFGVGGASPASAPLGGTTLLTVTVTPGSLPTSISYTVTGNLSAIGGSPTQAFLDDGNNGDVAAGDLVFSYQTTVGGSPAPGSTALLPVTVTDDQARTSNGTARLVIEYAPLTPIHDIQGAGELSPKAGQSVTTSGVVVGVAARGFFIMTPDADLDADAAGTSDGLYIFTSSAPPPSAAVGNLVHVTGAVSEYPAPPARDLSVTEMAYPTGIGVYATGQPLPTPAVVTVDDLTPGGVDPRADLLELERFEGMRVAMPESTVAGPTNGTILDSNTSTGLMTTSGYFFCVPAALPRPTREEGMEFLDWDFIGDPAAIPAYDMNPQSYEVKSDGLVGATPVDVPVGATVSNLVGILDYAFRIWTVYPEVGAPPTVTGGFTDVTPLPAPGPGEVTAATMNLRRFYDDVDDPAVVNYSDGVVENILTPAAYAARLAKASLVIRTVMQNPDVIGVEEIENVDVLTAIATQTNTDNATGGITTTYTPFLVEGNDFSGIDVGFLVNTTTVTPGTATQHYAADTFAIGDCTGRTVFDHPPLSLPVTVGTPPLTVNFIVNHPKSLSGLNDDEVHGTCHVTQGSINQKKRYEQAIRAADLVQSFQDLGQHVVSLGDFNAYDHLPTATAGVFSSNDGYVDVVGTVRGQPAPAEAQLVSQSCPTCPVHDVVDPVLFNPLDGAWVTEEDKFTFSFSGAAQTIDHILVSWPLANLTTGFGIAHNNSVFPAIRANEAGPHRLSDHDYPRWTFTTVYTDLEIDKEAYSDYVFLGQPFAYSITVTNHGPNDATNVVVHDLVPDGLTVTSATGFGGFGCVQAGNDVTCTAPTLAASASADIAIQVTPTRLGLVENTATVSADTRELLTDNNSDTFSQIVASVVPVALVVDAPGTGGGSLNGILEPGELVEVRTSWTNDGNDDVAFTGSVLTWDGPTPATYTTGTTTVDYGTVAAGSTASCPEGSCYQLGVTLDGARPATHWDAAFTEQLTPYLTHEWTIHIGESFTDVAPTYSLYSFVETLLHNGVTTGCNDGTTYCPASRVPRSQMAMFIARAMAGGDANVPTTGTVGVAPYACAPDGSTSLFLDVAYSKSYCPHVHYLAAQGVTQGCGGGNYCPTQNVSRGQMAMFIARAVAGDDASVPLFYQDPDTGRLYNCDPLNAVLHFTDITATSSWCRHTHYLWARAIIDGYTATTFNPTGFVNRGQMAKFLVNAFDLVLYGP